MFNGMESTTRKKITNLASALCVCGAFLVLSQHNVLADDSSTGTIADVTSADSSNNEVSSSAVVLQASSADETTSSAASSAVTSSADSVVESTVTASSASVAVDSAQSNSAAVNSSSEISSSTADVASANVVDLGAEPSESDIAAAKAAADEAYATTGQPQVVTMMDAASYSYTDAFLDSIKTASIQGWVNYGILPSVTAAQAICESAWGRSDLATEAHNLFGIKGSYNGQSVIYPTQEWGSGGYYTINAAFRKYASNNESVLDHGQFLAANSRYSNLINNRSYVSVANNLHADGYATDPNYATTLIRIVQQYGLTAWDTEAFKITDTVNAGSLEAASVAGDSMYIRGWHVSTDAEGKNNAFVIILDASNNQELARYQITPTTRNDVANAYSQVSNSARSGFEISVPFTSQFAGKTLTIISRYSSSNDGNSDYVDYSFTADFNKNVANLENFSVSADGTLSASGWHAADATVKGDNHFIIIYDATSNKEIGHYKVDSTTRNDVAASYSDVYDAQNSGFGITAKYTSAMAGHKIQIVSRYSSSEDGNGGTGTYIDYWFDPKMFGSNVSSLDQFEVQGTDLVISGWHANDDTVGLDNRFVILYDKTKNREIERYSVDELKRNDVAVANPSVYDAGNSGFSLRIKLTQAMIGDEIQVVSRYSSSAGGEGRKVDAWFDAKTFGNSAANLDNFTIKGDQLYISGWDANDYGAGLDNRYIIVYDKTDNKEITRVKVDDVKRNDVYNQYSNYYNALNSGFETSIKLTSAMIGHEIQVVSRYSDASNGEGNHVDQWFAAKTFNTNDGRLDTVSKNGNLLTVSGWHVSDSAVDKPYNYMILWDATSGKEVSRQLVQTSSRADVGSYLSGSYNSTMSGFSDVKISTLKVLKGHALQIVSRYSNSANGEGQHSDIWFDKFYL